MSAYEVTTVRVKESTDMVFQSLQDNYFEDYCTCLYYNGPHIFKCMAFENLAGYMGRKYFRMAIDYLDMRDLLS